MKNVLRYLLSAVLLAPLLTGCGTKDTADETATDVATPTETTAAEVPTEATPTENPAVETANPSADATFDLTKVPVSTANLGRFPYVSGPKGYKFPNPSDSAYYEFDRSYVYDGKQLIPVEGKVLRRQYRVIDDNKKTSELMQQRNYENLIKSLGGVPVSSAELPREAIEKVGNDTYKKYAGNISSGEQVDTYLIRQKDKEVWIQIQPGDTYMDVVVTERAAMPQQVTTIPADELKKN